MMRPSSSSINGGLGFRSSQQYDWRANDPNIDSTRGLVRNAISRYLQQQATGQGFSRQIDELSFILENQLFGMARSKEEYVHQESFYFRLQFLIEKHWALRRNARRNSDCMTARTTTNDSALLHADGVNGSRVSAPASRGESGMRVLDVNNSVADLQYDPELVRSGQWDTRPRCSPSVHTRTTVASESSKLEAFTSCKNKVRVQPSLLETSQFQQQLFQSQPKSLCGGSSLVGYFVSDSGEGSMGKRRSYGTNDQSSDDGLNPMKCRKLDSNSHGHLSFSGVSGVTEKSVCQQQFGYPIIGNLDCAEANVITDSQSPTIVGEVRDSAFTDYMMSGRYSESMPKPVEDLCPDAKEEIPQPQSTGYCSQLVVEKSEERKVDGISLTEFFTVGEIRQHMSSLRQKVDCIDAEVERAPSCDGDENSCQICALGRLEFRPTPIYCSGCGMQIKDYATYYSSKDENRGILFCSSCYKGRRRLFTLCETFIPKTSLVSKKNNLVTDENWVQCDKCRGWQHQICGLYNPIKDLGDAEYICPKCIIDDLEAEKRIPLPRSTAFDAKNLPRTLLSNHIEQRLFTRLKREREERAKAAGKTVEQVPKPIDLVVRVVSCVNKTLKVKQQFLSIFHEEKYPAEFPYTSKVILLFQRIEGVDVCLFAMYVQEYGSDCRPPNQRCVYISYLDSVKYFKPEVKATSGEALRTFVYHEILVGYLDYCKKRGFGTCYIWASPPVKGADYILYSHPEKQKTPNSFKLRQWYQSMLKKASKENIVVNVTNIFEKFFVSTGERNTKVTAATLPYFYGDYLSCIVESVIKKIEHEPKSSRRSLKSTRHSNSPENVKDILVMQELEQSILSVKEDLIVVHLQHVCTHCHKVILSGKRWSCNECKNFKLCDRCHSVCSDKRGTHISPSGQEHALTQEMVIDVPADTVDNDAVMDNRFMNDREFFLKFCQDHHYQFDSFRRAKHSSMMVLFHLYNSMTCSLCLKIVGDGPRWTCEICPGINVCGTCYDRSNGSCHSHTLTRHPRTSTSETEKKVEMVRSLLDVLLHASRCETTSHPCSYPQCMQMKRLLSHTHTCKVQVSGGCRICKKARIVLFLHSQACKDMNCGVPQCMDLKKASDRRQTSNAKLISRWLSA